MQTIKIPFSKKRLARSLAPYVAGAVLAAWLGMRMVLEPPAPPLWRIVLAIAAAGALVYGVGEFEEGLPYDVPDLFVFLVFAVPIVIGACILDLYATIGVALLFSAGLAACHVALMLRLALTGPAVIVDGRGVEDRTHTWGFGLVSWDEVEAVRSVSENALVLAVEDGSAYAKRLHGSRRLHAAIKADDHELLVEWDLCEPNSATVAAIRELVA